MIKGFNGDYRFLSNFWPSPIEFEGITYPTVEHAYQAAKTLDDEIRSYIATLPTPGAAKRSGRGLSLRKDWNDVKLIIMETLLRKKFYDPVLKGALLATTGNDLYEYNYWHDNYWGTCGCAKCGNHGENHLGNLLMQLRNGTSSNYTLTIDVGVAK